MTQAQVESRVESWNWNMNIFEIYDELRDNHTSQQQEQLLTHAYKFFNILQKYFLKHFYLKF